LALNVGADRRDRWENLKDLIIKINLLHVVDQFVEFGDRYDELVGNCDEIQLIELEASVEFGLCPASIWHAACSVFKGARKLLCDCICLTSIAESETDNQLLES